MSSPERLTVIIPCKNERLNIRPCIEAVRPIADEILVADSGSTDSTLDIVKEMGGCRIIEREYIHSGDFKNWAIPQAAHPWVLIVDADERVAQPLAEEIRATLQKPRCDGYWIHRENYYLGHRIRYSGWQNDCCLRLFRRDQGRYVGDTDHAEVHVDNGRVGRLKNRLRHYTYWTYDQYFRKFHRYTWRQAHVWSEQNRRPSYLRMLLTVPVRFLHTYILRRGFLDGAAGLQLCMMTAFYSFTKQARLWEHCYALRQPDPEQDASHQQQRKPTSRAA